MPESKHILTSKIFISAAVGLLASMAMSILRQRGIDVIITADIQIHITTVLMGLIAFWRTGQTKSLYIKKAKDNANTN